MKMGIKAKSDALGLATIVWEDGKLSSEDFPVATLEIWIDAHSEEYFHSYGHAESPPGDHLQNPQAVLQLMREFFTEIAVVSSEGLEPGKDPTGGEGDF